MKTIKLKYYGFWANFDPETFVVTRMLRKYFDVQICDDADYAIISALTDDYDFLKFKGVRIFFSAENVSMDPVLFDYGIAFDHMVLEDRYLRFPYAFFDGQITEWVSNKHVLPDDLLDRKEYFCALLTNADDQHHMRSQLFEKLSAYKPVISCGKFLKNSDMVVPFSAYRQAQIEFYSKAKFVFCIENTSFPGYVTEKLPCGLASRAIPIYFGDPYVADEFNEDALIHCHKYLWNGGVDSIVERIVQLDQDDDAYLNVLRQPSFKPDQHPMSIQDMIDFLVHIFEQDYEKAFRRADNHFARNKSERLIVAKTEPNVFVRGLNKVKRVFG